MRNFGKRAKDKVTGFTGIIYARCSYITGCDQYGLMTKAGKDGSYKTDFFDVHRVEILGEGVSVKSVADARDTGGPQIAPSASNARR